MGAREGSPTRARKGRGGQEIRVTARGCDHRQGRQMPNFETRGLLLSGSLAPLLDPAPSIRRRLVGA